MRISFLVVLVTGLLTISCSRTYYIVRHAEKAAPTDSVAMNTQGNPPLSEAGKVRAIVLRDLLAREKIRHIFSTNTLRTRSTAEPLSQKIGVPIQFYVNAFSLDSALKAIKKGNILIVGHSNTVDEIVNNIAGSKKLPGDLMDSD